ncbi:uncharacterized protein KY384_005782 [Bacidia gigantensis]|uniref:uncharacterized protein n=1 Tax=Bacidia gigantensis TaxID=2732470 RepID=UPI001D058A4C|nr:uncharacterized protein KY384_005782 [Bacidia gigantensis]KAG8529147.1 hypothetical protein KY384_005782 [Bacidia gigantensis]
MSTYEGTVLVTGGTAGLGYHAALQIAKQHPDYLVIIASRTNTDSAAEKINGVTGQQNVEFQPLDLSSLVNVRGFYESYSKRSHAPIKALLLNAGLQFPNQAEYSVDGIEKTFAIAHVGHALLFYLLRSSLAPDARIVITASGVHDPAQKTGMPPAKGKKWTVNSFDPGLMPGTGLGREYRGLIRFMWDNVLPRMLPPLRLLVSSNIFSPEESGQNLTRLAVGNDVKGISGVYYEGKKEVKSSVDSYKELLQEDLYEWTVDAVASNEKEKTSKLADVEKRIDNIYNLLQTVGASQAAPPSTVPQSQSGKSNIASDSGNFPSNDDLSLSQSAAMFPPTPSSLNTEETTAGLSDVITKGILSYDDAEEALTLFKSDYAAVSLNWPSNDPDMSSLRHDHPFLLQSVLTIAYQKDATTQQRLDSELRETMARRVYVDGTKDLDLLNGLVVYVQCKCIARDGLKAFTDRTQRLKVWWDRVEMFGALGGDGGEGKEVDMMNPLSLDEIMKRERLPGEIGSEMDFEGMGLGDFMDFDFMTWS